jgi:phosphoglycerate dehydrogenase-like enzyme
MSDKKSIELLITLPMEESQLAAIRAVSKKLNVSLFPAKAVAEISPSQWEKIEILFTNSRILPEPEAVPYLRWIQLNYAGVNKALDKPIIQQGQVITTSTSGVIVSQVAEYAVTACLALGRRLPALAGLQHEHSWPRNAWETLVPRELRGSTVGIVGYGSIGREVARLLQPFGVRILAAKKDAMHPQDSGYIQEGLGDPEGTLFERLYPVEALTDMLPECDFVVIALPLTDETLHIIDAAVLASMKSSAYLVNVGRGDIIDEEALIMALKEGRIAGAALDVFSQEPLPGDSPLWDMPNVIVTPHIAGLSPHLTEDTVNFFIKNLQRYLEELPLYNQVDLEKGY